MFTNNLAPKFLLPISLLMMFMSFALSFYFIRHETSTIISERINYSDSLARNLAYNSEYGTLTKNSDLLNNLVNGLMKEKDVIAITITNEKRKHPCQRRPESGPIQRKFRSYINEENGIRQKKRLA